MGARAVTSYIAPDMFEAGPAVWPFGGLLPQSYDLIMADPPWCFELYSEAGKEKSAQAHYATMTMEEIAALPVADLARADCLLVLWATAPMLPQQILVGEAWGFRYVTSGTWVKKTRHGKTAFGTGYVLRNAHEPFMIMKRGDPKTTRSVRSVIEGRVREHSRKPNEAYAAFEALMPGPAGGGQGKVRRAELFSRTNRKGWDAWGDEAGKFGAEEMST